MSLETLKVIKLSALVNSVLQLQLLYVSCNITICQKAHTASRKICTLYVLKLYVELIFNYHYIYFTVFSILNIEIKTIDKTAHMAPK